MRFQIYCCCLVAALALGCTKTAEPPDAGQQRLLKVALASNDYDQALSLLTELIANHPDNVDFLASRATVYLMKGNGQEAAADFDRASKIDKTTTDERRTYAVDKVLWMARRAAADEDFAEAVRLLDAIIHVTPKSGLAFHDRADAKLGMEDYEGAIADLTLAIQFDEGHNQFGDSYRLRARAYRGLGDEGAAEADEARVAELRAE